MANKPIVKQNAGQMKANTLESLKDFGSSTARNVGSSLKDLGAGMLDQFFGTNNNQETSTNQEQSPGNQSTESKPSPRSKKEANIFNYNEYHESVLVKKEIKNLVEQIRREIQYIKKADASLLSEIQDIQKIAIDSLPEKPGIYHVRFLEIVLRALRLMREKIGESRTWMQALQSKKKKRGSLFAARSKKSGTQYSQSQELSTSRSVQ
jgi:hypothetical protein